MSDSGRGTRSLSNKVTSALDPNASSPTELLLTLILRIARFVGRQSEGRVLAFSAAWLIATSAIDKLVGPQIVTSLLYSIPICCVTGRVGRRAGMMTVFASAFLPLANYFLKSPCCEMEGTALWNAFVRLVFFLIVFNAVSAFILMQQYVQMDYLTRLVNRRGFYKFAEIELNRCRRHGRGFSVVFLDLDK